MRVTVLSGGIGGARFTRGLLAHLREVAPDGAGGTTAEVTVVANTGDDVWLHGVRVCPDLDTLMYTLGGAVHEGQGWGRRDESSRVSADLAAYDVGWEWFTLGDLDLATHLARTQWLREGLTLSQATERLCRRWSPGARLLPMADTPVETHVELEDGRLVHFEEWWVRHRAALPARRFVQVGLEDAVAAPGVLDALTTADVVLLPPSNPVVSIGTILAVPGIRDALATTAAPVVGIAPVVGGAPVRGMADACLRAIGVATTADAIARHYGRRGAQLGDDARDRADRDVTDREALPAGVLDGWLVDEQDRAAAESLVGEGWPVTVTDTLMRDVPATAAIAAHALALADEVRRRTR
ncbi:2-phospho-L-lactate transferase [Cellulomonas marina]|uniref:LPPG:FO 2-phospho-L-lactate transferase n=1 Tax=Cellulomonas marina TaxID=988821 RepID=A0A1I0VB51_9CELL|nr:2-phospho-L-lactate transferase [Cellulomonas marina]GIG29174.1 2-phospho-L-lactate transferase [Cellulomonas marina]SFA73472.1 LPPG:FO 2-phospho-L-lactate transferase [Cellulomonas marina]